MSKANTLFIGLDVHKETTDAAWVSDQLGEAVQYHGTILTNIRSFGKLIKNQLAKATKLCVIYEAGPCGFWLYRYLQRRGVEIVGWDEKRIPTSLPKLYFPKSEPASKPVAPLHMSKRSSEAPRRDRPAEFDYAWPD
ncbi:hypothetical protein [Gallaecimonas sp. GXIMD4217]|uniref:hypothetical protein n=1 Tax=Gallaecimonas sp. GXIMD4217 TaxID=3131927 RepID=UPI00311ACE80